jgi:Fe-S oxidoreductase
MLTGPRPKPSPVVRDFIASLRKNMTVEDFTALEACLDCRHCGSACAWHLATGEAKLHPKYKKDFIRDVYHRHIRLIGRLGEWLGFIKPLSESTLRDYMPYFWKCTTCGRCTLACPLGLSNRDIVRLARAAFCDAGLIMENPALREVYEFSRDTRHSFGLTPEKIHLRLGLFLAVEGTQIPFDVPGADYLFTCAAVGNTKFPDYGIKIPKLLNAAGIRYTFSSKITDTGTDIEYVIVHHELSRQMLEAVEAEALRLGVHTVLISECGCDLRTFYMDAGEILGRPFRLAVQTVDSLLLAAVRSGTLPVEKLPGRVTFHDSCKITRLSGMGQLGRELMAFTTDTLMEMTPNGEMNYCCNGGTGPLRLPENNELRRKISHLKAEQIKATAAERVVTPCSVCMLTLEDICQTYGLTPPSGGRTAFLLFEQVYEAVEKALQKCGELARMRVPAVFQNAEPDFVQQHSMAGRLEKIFQTPLLPSLLNWLEQDAVVARYARLHPETAALLVQWRGNAQETRP